MSDDGRVQGSQGCASKCQPQESGQEDNDDSTTTTVLAANTVTALQAKQNPEVLTHQLTYFSKES